MTEVKKNIEMEVTEAIKKFLKRQLEERKDLLLWKNEEDYFRGYDEDYVDVGVGGSGVCVRRDKIIDEELLESNAKEEMAEEIIGKKSEDLEELICDEDFLKAIKTLVERL